LVSTGSVLKEKLLWKKLCILRAKNNTTFSTKDLKKLHNKSIFRTLEKSIESKNILLRE
jgi:hypothetical protein